MSEFWQRVLIASTLSLAGCLITYILTTSHNKNQNLNAGKDAVALISNLENEVERRPSERLVWRRAFDKQMLYSGEAVRTDSDSTATLEFINKKTSVQLDPDTVIEIDNDSNGINLDFLKGNLFIKADDSNTVTVNSGGKKLALANAEVAMSKSDVNADLQMEVSKGTVTDSNHDFKQEQRIEVTKPLHQEILYTQPKQKRLIEVGWKPIAKQYQMSVETGSSPNKLSKLTSVELTSGDSGSLSFSLPEGRHYWRLVATDTNRQLQMISSFPRKIEIRPRLAPITLEPARNSQVLAVGTEPNVLLRWANPGRLENIVVEFARSNDLRTDYGSVRAGGHSIQLPLRWKEGDIFWRVSGTIPGTSEAIAGSIAKFTLTQNQPSVQKIAPPPMTPSPSPSIAPSPSPTSSPSPPPTSTPEPRPTPTTTPKPQVAAPMIDDAVKKEGVMGAKDGSAELNWKPAPGASSYQIEVRDSSDNLIDAEKVTGTSLKLTNLKTGVYKATLSSIDENGEVSDSSVDVAVKIPEYSSVRAPKIKSLNVK